MFLRRRVLVVVVLLVGALTSVSWAQRFRVMEGPGMPLRIPPPQFSDGAFTICKMIFTSNGAMPTFRRSPTSVSGST